MLRLLTENTLDREEKIMAEWSEKSLGEIAEVTKLAGFEFTKYIEYNNDGEIIALRALNLRNGELDLTDIKRISREVSDGLTRSKIYKDDILLTYTGNGYGDCAIIEENDKYHLAPNICKIVPNKEVVFPYYLYCYIRSKAFYNQMSNNMTGSGQPTIPMKTIRLLKIPVPEMRVQVNIANMIWSLNQKIRNNKEINNNLEQQAQAIYQQMFIDNARSNWAEGTLSDIADITMGQSPSGSSYNEDGTGTIFFQGRAEFGFRFPSVRLYTTEPKRMARSNDTLMSVRAPVGDLNVAHTDCCIGRGLAAIHSKSNHQSFVLYTMFSLKKQLDVFNGEGTVFGSINRNSLNDMPILIPSDDILDEFERIVAPMDLTIRNNYDENCRLQNICDTLLPRLMSGELDVSDIDI